MSQAFTFTLKRSCFDENYNPSENTRTTTNFANLARGEKRQENLRNTRAIIDQYKADTGRYPDSLEQLVEKKYLRELPMDPITESRETWIVEPPQEEEQGEVGNIKSGAPGNGRKGKPYAEW